MGSLLKRLDAYQRRRRWAAFPFAVVKKFGEDEAGNLAALIAYYAFFSVFPLLLAFSTILGFVLQGHPDWQHEVTTSALKNLPLVGNHQAPPRHGSVTGLVLGLALALWSGLAVAKTAQTAFNTVYLVPRVDRPSFFRSLLNSLLLITVGGLGLIATTVVSGAVTSAGALGFSLGIVGRALGVVLTIVLNTGLFLVLFRWLTVRRVAWRDAFPGALLAAVALEGLQLGSTAIIVHKLQGAQSTYANFGTVVVLLSWFYLQAQVVLLAAEVNVVKQYKLWPRALTDPPATEADYRAYEAYAERERYRPNEDVDTSFDGKDNAADRRRGPA
jgi:membrane protein